MSLYSEHSSQQRKNAQNREGRRETPSRYSVAGQSNPLVVPQQKDPPVHAPLQQQQHSAEHEPARNKKEVETQEVERNNSCLTFLSLEKHLCVPADPPSTAYTWRSLGALFHFSALTFQTTHSGETHKETCESKIDEMIHEE